MTGQGQDLRADPLALRKKFMPAYYAGLQRAREEGKLLAYTTAFGPTELLFAMGVEVCMPENYVTICCAKQMAQDFCETAERKGVSPDICSYVRCGLGMMYREEGPMGRLPKPDFIVGMVSGCDPHAKWWEIEAAHFGVPLFLMEAPFQLRGEPPRHHRDWMVSEFKRLIAFVQENFPNRFDIDRFRQCMELSGQAHEAFQEIQLLRRQSPCPRNLREILGDLFYLITQPGRPEAVEYFSLLLAQVREAAQDGQQPPTPESFRLYYHNIPLWYRLQTLDWLAAQGAQVVCDHYSQHVWHGFYFDGGSFDPQAPFESLAGKWLGFDNHLGLPLKVARTMRSVAEWGCHGAIFFSNRSCKVYTIGQGEHIRALKEKSQVPCFVFEGEMADPRSFSMESWQERMQVFLDILAEKGAAA